MAKASPDNIFSRLETLRRWQEEQQDRLRRRQDDHEQFLSKEQKRLCEAMKDTSSCGGRADTVLGVCELEESYDEGAHAAGPVHNTHNNSIDPDEKPINTPRKDFAQMLEEKLQLENVSKSQQNNVKPKKAFLRKGAGLRRFRLPQADAKHRPTTSSVGKRAATDSGCSALDRQVRTSVPVAKHNAADFRIRKPILKRTRPGPVACWASVLDRQKLAGGESANDREYRALLEEISTARSHGSELDDSIGQKAFEQALEREIRQGKELDELRVFELLEQKATSSSFCSTSSLVTRLLERPAGSPVHVTFREEGKPPSVQDDTSVNSDDVCSLPAFFPDGSTWSDDSGTAKTSEEEVTGGTALRMDAAVNTDGAYDPLQTELLRARLEQLEMEIRVFREENSKVDALRRQLEADQRNFEERKAALQTQLELERADVAVQLDDERRRLQRDRAVYERYIKDSRGKNSKKEREEIALLQTQLANAREEIKLKDSRHGAALARCRNQLKCLEKEVASLRTQNEELRRQNGRLEAARKLRGRPTDTRMLHEINRNLSKLAQDATVTGKSREKSTVARLSSDNRERPGPDLDAVLRPSSPGKENEASTANCVMPLDAVVREYEQTFGGPDEAGGSVPAVDRQERLLPDGSKEMRYGNGNVKVASADGRRVTMRYYNGDVKETNLDDGTVRYYYAQTGTWHTTHADGDELLEFPNGQVERRRKDGSGEVHFPDGSRRFTFPDGTDRVHFADGTVVETTSSGDKTLTLPNGQKEVHTHEHKRREYPDGTVKLLYADGVQETRYANGRIRLRDQQGRLLLDSVHP